MKCRLANVGKVRDTYEVLDDPSRLCVVATDRVSAYDRVMFEGIPSKGKILSGLSMFWFDQVSDLVSTQEGRLVGADELSDLGLSGDALIGRVMMVRKAEMLPFEFVVRGYLAGSALSEYKRGGTIGGKPAPRRLHLGSKMAEPTFTPTTKELVGHDVPIGVEELSSELGSDLAEHLKNLSIKIFEKASKISLDRGFVLADTKFEFGFIDGELALCDEVLTPDSSRYWTAQSILNGEMPEQLDKQVLRDWLTERSWSGEGEAPHLPESLIDTMSQNYRTIYEQITRESFDMWEGSQDRQVYLGSREIGR